MKEKHLSLILMAPSLVLTAFIILYPLLDLVELSTHAVSRFGKLQQFTGLENITRVLSDSNFVPTLWRTAVWTFGVVGGTILISIPVALILNTDFYGRGLARVIVMLPWAVSLTMMAIVWRWALHGEFGFLNKVLMDIGLLSTPVVWLAEAGTAFPVQIVIGILVSIPFTVTIFLGGLSSLPTDIYEAASVSGANAWQKFRLLTLPLLKPFITIAVVLNVIYVFNSFPIIWVLTQGGPANGTDILVTYLYKLAFRFGRLGDAAALSLLMFGLLLVFTLIYVRMVTRNDAKT